MEFLIDQDVYALTTAFLRAAGHDVVTAHELGLARPKMLNCSASHASKIAFSSPEIRDFGSLVFVQGGGPGVIYLRVLPSAVDAVHTELHRVLTTYSEHELQRCFVVVEPARHRIRNLA